MAVKTEHEITYKCGHDGVRDLSDKPAGKRAGFAEWLAKQPCFECHRKATKGKVSAELQKEREENAEHVRAESERLDLAVLRGSDKQIDWAMRARHELLEAAYKQLVEPGTLTEDEYAEQVTAKARLIDRAGWWIENRDIAGADLPEILADPGVLVEAASTENPF
ncbi:hypothetical protein [Agromyces sp. NPDC058126]|uniref:hypothetical protein n=1 Tax=Agromyces sp. NPDC058126 TaxID=3346350 RepID=UPI0036D8A78E